MPRPKSALKQKDKLVHKKTTLEREKFFINQMFTRNLYIQDRVIVITGEIQGGGSLFSWFDACMTILERRNCQAITVRIQSNGGSTYDTCAIVGRMRASKCDIVTEAYGEVFSSACLMLAAGDKRRISRYAWAMHHESITGMYGKISDLEDRLKQEQREELAWTKWMGELTKRDAKFWAENGRGTDFFMTPDEAVEFGVADEVIG